jgi:hypothetical protein
MIKVLQCSQVLWNQKETDTGFPLFASKARSYNTDL